MSGWSEDTLDDVRFRILRILEIDPEMSQRQLAQSVGVSLGRINYVLAALIDKGLVKLDNLRTSHDKRRYAYVLTPRGIREKARITRAFLIRKTAEYEALRAEIEALEQEVGPAWSGEASSRKR